MLRIRARVGAIAALMEGGREEGTEGRDRADGRSPMMEIAGGEIEHPPARCRHQVCVSVEWKRCWDEKR